MTISWDFFTGRRRIDVKKWVTENNVTSYEELVRSLKKIDVVPPPPWHSDIANMDFKRVETREAPAINTETPRDPSKEWTSEKSGLKRPTQKKSSKNSQKRKRTTKSTSGRTRKKSVKKK